MSRLKNYKRIALIFGLVLFFKTTLFADVLYSEDNYINSAYSIDSKEDLVTDKTTERINVSLDSFGSISVIIMLVLTSILGAFFVRDEFSEVLD